MIKSLYMGEGELDRNSILPEKYRKMKEDEVRFEMFGTEDAETIVVAFGTAARIAFSAVKKLRSEGSRLGFFRPISLFLSLKRNLHLCKSQEEVYHD